MLVISSKEKNRAGRKNEKKAVNFDKIIQKAFSEKLAVERRPEREGAAMQTKSFSGQRNSRAAA